MQLTRQQKDFFEAFGFLQFPGVLRDEIQTVSREFESVFEMHGIKHDTSKRSCFVPFIDQREKLCALLDHPVIHGIATGLLGADYNYTGSDGNYYTGDTPWHPDGQHRDLKHIKIAFYLDTVTRDTGALRVIPGSHRLDEYCEFLFRDATRSPQAWGIEMRDVPSVALESEPGDLVAFNHNLMHAAFGGSTRRRMFTINLAAHAANAAGIQDLHDFIGSFARFWIDEPFSKTMRETASPERMRHLKQVIEQSDHLPGLAAQARATMSEPSRG